MTTFHILIAKDKIREEKKKKKLKKRKGVEKIVSLLTTGQLSPTSTILPPADVRPGHMMFAPLRTNLIAPRSTWKCGIMFGSDGAKGFSSVEIFSEHLGMR